MLLKGGHLAGDQEIAGHPPADVTDVLFDGQEVRLLTSPFVPRANTHGTGCTLSAALAAELAKGSVLPAAVAAARGYLNDALRLSAGLRIGGGRQQPFNHGFALSDWRMYGSAAGGGSGSGGRCRLHVRAVDLRLYAVTDTHCNRKAGRSLVDAVRQAVAGGAGAVQLREKEVDGGDFLSAAREVIQVCRPHGVAVLINDRVDVALAAGADGVHVGQSDLPAAAVRELLPPHMLLGVSVRTPAQALAAARDGADYVGAGAVFPTTTKDSGEIGLALLSDIVAASPLPVVAIGGINAANAALPIRAGCAGVAVVSALFAAPDVTAAAAEILRQVEGALGAAGGNGGGGGSGDGAKTDADNVRDTLAANSEQAAVAAS